MLISNNVATALSLSVKKVVSAGISDNAASVVLTWD